MTLDLILLGLAIALEPLPLTAYLLMLSSDRGPRKGLGYLDRITDDQDRPRRGAAVVGLASASTPGLVGWSCWPRSCG